MLGVYRVNYTIIGDDHSFTDYFFCRDMNEIKESIKDLCTDYDATNPQVADGCITAAGNIYDLLITIESTMIIDEFGLTELI